MLFLVSVFVHGRLPRPGSYLNVFGWILEEFGDQEDRLVDVLLLHVVADVLLEEREPEDEEILGPAVNGVVLRRDLVDLLEPGGRAEIDVGLEPGLLEVIAEARLAAGDDVRERGLVADMSDSSFCFVIETKFNSACLL